jgi:predicted DNA-binding transcriptional regulator AlpA
VTKKPAPNGTKRWLDVGDLSAYTNMSKSYWDKRRHFGDGPPYARIGSRCLYDIADVDKWLEQHKVGATAAVQRRKR